MEANLMLKYCEKLLIQLNGVNKKLNKITHAVFSISNLCTFFEKVFVLCESG